MDNTGLIFIPDISGFTRFVSETELEHSRYIIEELLETIINANQLGLSISEIEGDAILFYKFGDPPGIQHLVTQVEKMFCEFHKHIRNYELRRLCQCAACKKAVGLSLKVIIHYGEFSSYKVKEFSKLLGKDIIVAHQLLKNDIDMHEYMLITDRISAKEELHELPAWVNWNAGKKLTEAGEVPYNYSMLTSLKDVVAIDPPAELEPREKAKMLSVTHEYNIDFIDLLAVVGNFSKRSDWMEGFRKVEKVTDKLPRLGTSHSCILDKGTRDLHFSYFSSDPDKITFGETDDTQSDTYYYIFEKVAEAKTRLTITYFMRKNKLRQILFNLAAKKSMSSSLERSLRNLEKHIGRR